MQRSLSELRSHPSFSRVNKELLMYMLNRNELKIREVDLFRLALQWANNQLDVTKEQSLKDVLPLIRFPVMTLKEFTTAVVPTGLLSQSTLVELFTYFGTDAETKKSMAVTLKLNTRTRRSTDSIQYIELYSGNLARKRLFQLSKLEDCLQISTRITGTTAMGISGISVYCPARSTPTTFKEFKIVLKAARRKVTRGPAYKNLLSMSPVQAEEGKVKRKPV